jgi:hypothetical protein
MARAIVLAAVLVAACVSAAAGDFPYDQFKPAVMSGLLADENALIALMPDAKAKSGSEIAHPPVRARVLMTFTGQHRPIDAATRRYIDHYSTSMSAQAAWAPLFQEEYLFQAEGKDWWLPTMQQITTFFSEELKPGDPVNIYLVAAGSVLADGTWRTIFLAEEFQTPTNSP